MRKLIVLLLLFAATPLLAQEEKAPAASPEDQLQQLIDSGANVELPTFKKGGLDKFRAWLLQHIDYPAECLQQKIEGHVKVQFVIEKDGSISRFEVLESPHELLTNEVLEAMERSPRWTPLRIDGVPTLATYAVPIDFSIPQRAPRQMSVGEEDPQANPYRKEVGRSPRKRVH